MSSDETQSHPSTAPLPQPQSIPTQIGPYRILETLGEGGMGTVFKAEQRTPVKRIVALKLIKPGFDTAEVIARFQSERQALARMDHPHVAKVLDAGADDLGRPYFVMEYVPGTPITKFADDKKLSIPERLELFIQVCEAIAHAHTKAIIHRDIKSTNVLAYLSDNKPMAKVIDFGVAKALTGDRLTDRTFNTARGEAIGTYESMSPEQADGDPDIDTRTDVYSLGVLLYELLTGLKPFDKITFAQAADHEIRRIIREVDPPRPSTQLSYLGETGTRIAANRRAQLDALTKQLRYELEWIPLMAMRKERDRRYANPLDLAADIHNYLHQRPLRAGPESIVYRARKYISRNTATLAAVVLIAALLIAGATTSIILALRARRAEKTVASQLDDLKFQRNQAIAANNRADGESAKLKRELSENYVDQGILAWDRDNPAVAMLYFIKALQLDAGDPQRELAQRIRIGTSLALAPRLLDIPPPRLDHETLNNGRRLVNGGNSLSIIDVLSNKPAAPALPSAAPVTSAAFSPDGKYIVVITGDNTARIWDAATGSALTPPIWHQAAIRHAAFSADARLLITASDDHTARIWDVATGQPKTAPINVGDRAFFAAFSPDSQHFVVCTGDDPLFLGNTSDGSSSGLLAPSLRDDIAYGAQFSPDSQSIAILSYNKTARIWDYKLGVPLTPPMRHRALVDRVTFSPDGQKLVTASQDNVARVWDSQTGDPITPPLEHCNPIARLAFSADASHVITVDNQDHYRIWSAVSTSPTRLSEYVDWDPDLTISPDRTRVITNIGSAARVWDALRARPHTPAMRHQNTIQSVAFSPDATRLVTTSSDRTARLWDANTGLPLTPPVPHTATVVEATFSPDGQSIISVDTGGSGIIWNSQTGKVITTIDDKLDGSSHVGFSPDGKYFVTCHSSPGRAQVRDSKTAARIGLPMEHRGTVIYAAFNPSSTQVVTGSNDNTARLWDALTGNPLTPPMEHSSAVFHAAFSPNGQYIVTCDNNEMARVWNAANGKPLTPPLAYAQLMHRTSIPIGEALILQSKNSSDLWTVDCTTYPIAKLEQLAQLLSAQRIDSTGTLVRLTPGHWRELWNDLRQQFPARFAPPPPRPTPAKQTWLSEWVEEHFGDESPALSYMLGELKLPRFFQRNSLAPLQASVKQLSSQIQASPTSALLYSQRGQNFARLGRFREASADLAKSIQLDPADHWIHLSQAALLAYLDQPEAYQLHCQATLHRFANDKDLTIGERAAKCCLILPSGISADSKLIGELVDRSLKTGPAQYLLPWFQATKGIYEYRAGRFQQAAGWFAIARSKLTDDNAAPLAEIFLAMTEHQLGNTSRARAILAETITRMDKDQPRPEIDDLGYYYHDWLICQIALREAQALINAKTPTTKPTTPPGPLPHPTKTTSPAPTSSSTSSSF